MTDLVLIFVLGALMQAARSFAPASGASSASTALSFGFLLLTAYFVGNVFKWVRLPRLTGYLAAGIVSGPAVLNFVPRVALERLSLVTGVATALIALTAGVEMDLRSMRPLLRSIGLISATAIGLALLLLFGAVLAVSPFLPFLASLPWAARLAVAAVLAVVMAAQSPAVAVAVRNEMRADGPLSKTVTGVVVAGDLVIVVLFALVSSLAKSVLGGGGEASDVGQLLGWEIVGSFAAGAFAGAIIAMYLSRVQEGAALFVLLVCVVAAEVGRRMHFDPLLIALAAGILVRNASNRGDALHHAIEGSSLPVYVAFFAVAGANIHLDVFATVGIPALVFVVVRGTGLLAGARLGARWAGASPVVRRYAGFGLLPQAGLALALALLFAKAFPSFGEQASALTLGIVAANEMLAPAIFRWALVKSGEADEPAPASAMGTPLPQPEMEASGEQS
jgi:Kef-type K+ transport system membrane component KefB